MSATRPVQASRRAAITEKVPRKRGPKRPVVTDPWKIPTEVVEEPPPPPPPPPKGRGWRPPPSSCSLS